MTYEFVEIDGAKLHYQVIGRGHPLVLIHAGIAHLDMWDDQVDALAQHYQVIRYDIRAEGKSANPPGVYSDHDDLRGLLQHLGATQAAVLGVSNGGRIAVDFTLAYPEMVSALIPVASGLGGYEFGDLDESTEQKWEAIEAAFEKGDIPLAAELETRFWVDGLNRTPDQLDPAMRAQAVEMSAYTFSLPKRQGDRQALEPAAISRLGEIKVPTLVIVGDQDLPDMLAIADLLAERITGAQKVVLPNTAHLPNMEQPETFNRVVLDFLVNG